MKHAEMVKLMGKMVLVNKVLERANGFVSGIDQFSKFWSEREIEPRTGWVVGFRTMQEGYVKPGSNGYHGIDGYHEAEPDEWRTVRVKKCVLVAFWPTEKPVHVPLDGYTKLAKGLHYLDREWIRKGMHGALRTAPDPYTTAGGWHENPDWRKKNADFMQEEMKNWPRDERGRWRKKS